MSASAAPAASAAATSEKLPAGLVLKDTEEGLALATTGGQAVYRLETDRLVKRRRGLSRSIEQRCADVCDRLWRPLAAPAGFKPRGEWTVTDRAGVAQLTYKGDPLYTFAGQSLDEAKEAAIVPPFFTSYSAKPVRYLDGVPVATLYWHPVLYQPAPPKTTMPAGVGVSWEKKAYVFADADKRPLYVSKTGAACVQDCQGLAPLPAPLAALPTGDWRPVDDSSGRYWSYKGKIAHRTSDAAIKVAGDWQPLQAR